MEDFPDLTEHCIGSEAVFDGTLLHIRKDTVRLPNGQTSVREYTVHHGAVCIVPLFENGDVLLERQFRYALGQVITEIPAGKLDSADEDPRLAALRELREETGYIANTLIDLGPYYAACAYSTETIRMYLAKDLTASQRELDADEFLNVFRVPLADAVRDVMDGKIPDAKTQAALLRVWLLEHPQP